MKSLTSAIKRFWLALILIVILHQKEAQVGSVENSNEDVHVQNEHGKYLANLLNTTKFTPEVILEF